MADARTALDNSLLVDVWRTVPEQEQRQSNRDPRAPGWWTSEEEASSSFLAAMGVNLGGP